MGIAAKVKYWPIFFIVGLWVIFSAPYFFKGLVPFPSDYLVSFFPPWNAQYGMPVKNNAMPDVITQIFPWKKFTIDTWKSGEIPLWNPYSFSGTPHAGNIQSAVFSPFNVLFFVLPFIDAWSVLVLIQPLLAGLFMYGFVRSLGRSPVASLLASIAFGFCGFVVVWMAYGTLGYAVLWLPFIFLGIHKRNGLIVSAGVALSFLSGHFQASAYILAAAVAYAVWEKYLFGFWYLVAGLALAAPQLLLGFHSFTESSRGLSVLKGEIIPWQYLLTFVAPDFFGNPVTRNDWFGHYAEWAGFVGVVPLMLALFISVAKKTREIWFFILLGLVSLLLALPTPFNDLLYFLKVPVLSGSAASRIIILTSFSLTVLSAFGFDELARRKAVRFAIWCVAFVFLVWAILLFANPLPIDKLAIAKRNFILPGGLMVSAALLFIVRKKVFLLALVALTAFDLLRFAAKWMPFENREYVYPQMPSLAFLKEVVGHDRVFGNIGNEVGTMFNIPLIEGYDAVYQARYGQFLGAVSKGFIYPGERSVAQFDKYGLFKTEALQLLGVRYVYHRKSDGRNVWVFPYWEYPSMRQVYSDESYSIFEYPDAFPRAFLASSYVVAQSDEEIIDLLFGESLNRRETLVLEEKPSIEPQIGDGSAQIVSYTPNRVAVKTTAEVPKILFLSDVFDSGWQATIDGTKTKVYRADYDFRAVAVPAGNHIIEFRYAPFF